MPLVPHGKSVTVTFNPHNQNLESLQRLVAQIVGIAGCKPCGRLAVLKIDFVVDPPPEFAKEGAISVQAEGL
jgi:hypothetical protein